MSMAGLLRGLGHTSFVALYSLISIAVVRPILTFFLVLRTWSWIIRSMDCPHSRPNDKSGLFHAGIAADDPYQDEGQLKFMIALILSWHG